MSKTIKFGLVVSMEEDISFPEDTWMNVVLQYKPRSPEKEILNGKLLYAAQFEIGDDEIGRSFWKWLLKMDEYMGDQPQIKRLFEIFTRIGFEHGMKYAESMKVK